MVALDTVMDLRATSRATSRISFKDQNPTLLTINSIQSFEKFKFSGGKKNYRSGAQYLGKFDGTNREGWGQFRWPNGAQYEGFHLANKRHGNGKYVWPDGSEYSGEFVNDDRHGYGEMKWANEECYFGNFSCDKREGIGIYTWPDGSRYEGSFLDNKKEGYGVFVCANGDNFEGMYKRDIRSGPGILTYKQSGNQDVGLWHGEKLIKICCVLDDAFMYELFGDHAINAGANLSRKIRDANTVRRSSQMKESPDHGVNVPETFPYSRLMSGVRVSGSPQGPLEQASEMLLQYASQGDVNRVNGVLKSGLVHVDVADRTGHTSIMAAAVNCHLEVLNCLLDYGADINKLSDEGLSALTACHILLYTEVIFINNIAENMPAENAFNAVELERRTGTVVNRNDRRAIMTIYNLVHTPFPMQAALKKSSKKKKKEVSPPARRISTATTFRQSVKDAKLKDAKTAVEGAFEEQEEHASIYDPWKVDKYHRSIDYVKEVEEINSTFVELMSHPHDLPTRLEMNDDHSTVVSDISSAHDLQENGDQSQLRGTTATPVPTGFDLISETQRSVAGCYGAATSHDSDEAPVLNDTTMLLINEQRKPHLENMIQLLLRRGASPNSSDLPMSCVFFGVKSADPVVVRSLLERKADTSSRLSMEKHALCPLHIAVALPCEEGVEITRLLLEYGADPNLRDGYYGDIDDGRTSLHIVCAREDNDEHAMEIARLLLQHDANPNLLCRGNSPISLAISSGNDLIVDVLLEFHADPSLRLTHGIGSALCAASCFQAERRRTPRDRIKLIDKLVKAGADLLIPVKLSEKLPVGTVVDYAYHVFAQDRRIACTPYHALSAVERECHNARRHMLEHLAPLLRTASIRREKRYLEEQLLLIEASKDVAAGGEEVDTVKRKQPRASKKKDKEKSRERDASRDENCALRFVTVRSNDPQAVALTQLHDIDVRRQQAKKRLRYCYECARSIGVRLSACTRCHEVFYCSKNCKVKAWNARHRDECAKISGQQVRSASRADSPTPTTDARVSSSFAKEPRSKSKQASSPEHARRKTSDQAWAEPSGRKAGERRITPTMKGGTVGGRDASGSRVHLPNIKTS